ncbi:sensor histidine kinase [Treponema primitia]|uniref:sensor histidine kinase n=1 Tax=Treponema primitia TaxID=88058 RepID=UPI0018E1B296|nr:HAMP domain-containing sensor histidine kinase [Treponema primitia]
MMTIKKRMIVTNILMIAVPVVLCLIAEFFVRAIVIRVLEAYGLSFPDNGRGPPPGIEHMPFMYLLFFGQVALIMGIFFASNMFFTRQLVKQIMVDHEKYENNRRELIAGISHDLRTPLTSIKAYLEGIETGLASTPEKRSKYFSIIKNKTNDLEHIINQLFLFSKLDIGEYPMNMQKVNLGHTLPEMLGELVDEYERRGLVIKQEQNVDDIYVNADYMQLRNVIINILENSVKYKTSEKAVLVINCSSLGNMVEINLTDDGPGVPPDALDKLFDVFYRTDPSRSNEKKGSGLGLAIADKTIRRMGGKIHAELPETGGLSIVIQLPIIQV